MQITQFENMNQDELIKFINDNTDIVISPNTKSKVNEMFTEPYDVLFSPLVSDYDPEHSYIVEDEGDLYSSYLPKWELIELLTFNGYIKK